MTSAHRGPQVVASVAGWVLAAPAQAHLVETGFGAFYDGIVHLWVTPADLLVVIAVALFAGQRGTQAARWTLFALPLAWLAGGLLGARLPIESTLPLWTTLTFGIAGALVALNVGLSSAATSILAAVAGVLHGFVNGASLAPGGASLLGLAGVVTAVFCMVAMLAAQVVTLRAGWSRIAVRAAGSWIAAGGVLMLGWLARPAA